jgi:prephenate dehydrogenase
LGSLKTPLRAGPRRALVKAGCRVTSLHPMFGPDTELLSGRHVIFIDLGDADALAEAQELFAPTMAERVVMGLDEHDRLIAYVLGLSHALNIAFFTALADSGEAAPRLATAVEHHLRFAAGGGEPRGGGKPGPVFRDPELERLRRRVAARLQQAVERLVAAVKTKNAPRFTDS